MNAAVIRIPRPSKRMLVAGAGAVAVGAAAAFAVPAIAAPHAPSSSHVSSAAATSGHQRKARLPLRVFRLMVKATVKETGLDRATVLQRLTAGETFAHIAGSKAQAVENDVLAAIQQRLDQAVARGHITKDQESALMAKAKTRVAAVLNKQFKNLGRRHRAAPSSPGASAAAGSLT